MNQQPPPLVGPNDRQPDEHRSTFAPHETSGHGYFQQPSNGQLPPPQFMTPDNYPGTYGAPAQNPGSGTGLAALITALLVWPVGLILSIISFNQSRRAGTAPTGMAIAGLVLSGVAALFWIVVLLAALLAPTATVDAQTPGEPQAGSEAEPSPVDPQPDSAPVEVAPAEPAPAVESVTYTCEDMVADVVPFEASSPLSPSLLQVYSPVPVTDNTAAFLSGALPVPAGQNDVLVLECTGEGMLDDASSMAVVLRMTVDVNGDTWFEWGPDTE